MSQEPIYIESVRLVNFQGLDTETQNLKIDHLGNINIVSGPNESGKTRILNALRFALTPGAKKAWMRTDDKGECEVLVNFSNGWKLSKKVPESGSIKTEARNEINKPLSPEVVYAKISDIGVDIGSFLHDKGWDYRRETIVKASGVNATLEEIKQKLQVAELPTIFREEDNIYSKLSKIDKHIREQRRDTNAQLKSQQETWTNLDETIKSTEIDGDPGADIYQCDQDIEFIKDAILKEVQEVSNNIKDIIATQEVRAEKLRNELSQVEEKIQTKMNELRKVEETVKASYQAEIARINGTKETAKQKQRTQIGLEENKRMRSQSKEKIDKLSSDSENYNGIIGRIKDWQKEISDAVVAGITMPEGEQDIYLDGVPWSNANTAKQVATAIQVAKLLCKECPVILVDDAEHLGNKVRLALFKAMKENNIQAFFADVYPDDLNGGKLKVENMPI